ncbi:hypothetical protein BY996DRAFT_4079935 [Phakopsora pachyrhizi]|uniref:Expressed protein n=1 Tax=Phakopsora pachyrhizi TaxID=170000 RepID=A0AAV0BNH6_PHAPC|nr:hypothetical protein BY996DRAFT_4079935 [Phakopsora pachyrhizi]CAH7687561.1 expressed protein [Phakopsora pachyrhizi]
MAMTRPDRAHIPQAMIFSQGILTTETLASKIAQFFSLRSVQLLKQPHYDFGFKSLKAVSISAGHFKRASSMLGNRDIGGESVTSDDKAEQKILSRVSERPWCQN